VAAKLAAGQLAGSDLAGTASKMNQARLLLRVKLGYGYEGSLTDQPDYQRINELLQASEIAADERAKVRAFAVKCYASERPWLIARLEAVITRRADASLVPAYEIEQLRAAA